MTRSASGIGVSLTNSSSRFGRSEEIVKSALLAVGLLLAGVGVACAADLRIVADGQSGYVIAIPALPNPAEELAAKELAECLEQMSGARLEIRKGPAVPARALVVCQRANLTGLIGTDANIAVEGDGYAVVARQQQILLVGGRGRSTLYAVYDFLAELGCRWLAPKFAHYDGTAEIVPKKRNLVWAPASRIERPALRLRTLNVEEGLSHTSENLVQLVEWMAKARYNTIAFPIDYYGEGRAVWDRWRAEVLPEIRRRDLVLEVGGHGYENFLNAQMEQGQLFQHHPEWFGLDEKGQRRPEHKYVFCSSNGDALGYLTANVIKYLQEHPEIEVFDFRPPDSEVWCACDACKALGSVSRKLALIATHVQGEVSKVRPGLLFDIQAYSRALRPPEQIKLGPEIIVGICPINQSFEFQIDDPASANNAEYADVAKAWRPTVAGAMYVYSYYRKYAWRSLPVVLPHYMQQDLRFYLKVPMDGVSCYAEPGNWFTYEVNSYILAHLAWNPAADVDALMADFCGARFAGAAAAAGQAYETLERTVPKFCNIPYTSLKSAGDVSRAEGEIVRAIAAIEAARTKAVDAAVQRALDKLLLMLQYARRDLGIQKLRALRQASGPKPSLTEIQTAIEELHEFLSQHAAEGVFFMEPRLTTERLFRWYYLGRKT